MDHILATQICVQARVPVFLWGLPGIGKSAVVDALAAPLGERFWTVILSIREPSDQGGLPVVRPDGVHMHPPLWATQLCEVGHGGVFWDEFNTAPPTTQSSALRVIHEGWAGDKKLPAETSHIAAGNPASKVTGGYDLTAAIANRWAHIDWPVDPNAYCEGMVQGWPEPPVLKLPANWKDGLASKRGLIASFIRRRPNLLMSMPASAVEQGRAWGSPRSWSRAAVLLTACASVGHDEKSSLARLCVLGCVGEGGTVEFTKWIANLDIIDPEVYLADPMGTPLPTRQDQTMATLDSIAAASLDKGRKDHIKRYYTAWRVIGRILKDQGDIAVPACRTMCGAIPKEVRKSLPPEIEEILPLLEKAGIDFAAASAK